MQTWVGSTWCDMCGHLCVSILYDARTNFRPWATMCYDCYRQYGVALGNGMGQKYQFDDDEEKFIKVEG